MAEKIDGGPAFPEKRHKVMDIPGHWGTTVTEYTPGMSLRDYFAGRACALFIATDTLSIDSQGFVDVEDAATLAANCYAIADAMLAEREKA